MKRLPVWVERRGGLDFSCTRCGDCCTGAPGYVWVEEEEIRALAALLALEPDAFGRRYLRRASDGGPSTPLRTGLSLTERASGECVFFEQGRGCTVYAARPRQCRTFPFWPENLRSAAVWDEVARRCPGVRAGGRRFAPEEIRALLNGRRET